MKKWIYLALIVGLILVSVFLGARFAGIGGIGILTWFLGKKLKNRESEIEESKQDYGEMQDKHDKEIREAGEDIEPKEYNNADDARDAINDFLDDDKG